MKIKYIKGDATCPQGSGKKIIAHVCNDRGGWGSGFVVAISKKWKDPEKNYREWYRNGTDFALGNIQISPTKQSDIFVANMIAQKGFGGVAIQYDKLRQCLSKLRDIAILEKASIHGPKFGSGLAGGDWSIIEKIIEEELCQKNIEVTIYVLD